MTADPSSTVCRGLHLRQFRNFATLNLVFPPEGVVLVGPNGSGKTNLIEAIYYLEIFRSFRGANDSELIRFDADAFFVHGEFEERSSGVDLEVTAAYQRRGRRKRVTVDGAAPERLRDAVGRVGAVTFSPSDVAIVAGAPSERRRFLDIVLSVNRRGYLGALQQYRRVLRQRNAMLRDAATPTMLAAWNERLVELGAHVMAERAAWIAEHNDGFGRRYAAIGADAPASLVYDPDVAFPAGRDEGEGRPGEGEASGGAPSREDAALAFRSELERTADRERERGVTLAGPHRDELRLLVETEDRTLDLRKFGSGGQQRTAAVALRMVEAETIRRARGHDPLILLDDIFAELDPGRAARLLERLEGEEGGQVILTTPKRSDLEVGRGGLPHWRIRDGEVVE